MKIYFYCPEEYKDQLQPVYPRFIDILGKAGALVTTNLDKSSQPKFSPEELDEMVKSGRGTLAQMNGLIIEITKFDPQITNLLAQAMAQKKPTYCLYHRNKPPRETLVFLKRKSIPKFIKTDSYTEEVLEKRLLTFLNKVPSAGVKEEIPSIKFTLRITPQIEKYLHWLTHNTKSTKADFLRDEIKKMMDEDKEYQEYLKKFK